MDTFTNNPLDINIKQDPDNSEEAEAMNSKTNIIPTGDYNPMIKQEPVHGVWVKRDVDWEATIKQEVSEAESGIKQETDSEIDADNGEKLWSDTTKDFPCNDDNLKMTISPANTRCEGNEDERRSSHAYCNEEMAGKTLLTENMFMHKGENTYKCYIC